MNDKRRLINKDRKLQQSEHCKFVKTQVGLQSSKFNIQGSSSIFNIQVQVQYSNLKLSKSSKFGKLRKPRNSERSQNLESQDKYKRSGINAACTFFWTKCGGARKPMIRCIQSGVMTADAYRTLHTASNGSVYLLRGTDQRGTIW